MAERRMFAKTIVLSDAFLDMPMSARCLYFTLGMLADDDGFVGNPKAIMRQCGASQDDMVVLLQKRFILDFESGVIVIKHWRMNNYLQNDRHKNTSYVEELATLTIDEKGAYTEVEKPMYTKCIQNVYTGKDSIDKDSIEYNNISSNEDICATQIAQVIEKWNTLETLGVSPVKRLTANSNRYKMLKARIKEYSLDEVLQAIEMIKYSSFLCRGNGKGWNMDFEWFVKPNNFPKVFEGKYTDREMPQIKTEKVIEDY